jgi:hypothetical protein
MEAEALFGNGGKETRAGLEVRVIELAITGIALEVRGVFGGKECTLVVIEPPGYLGRWGVLEVYDRVLIAGKISFVEERPRAVQQSAVLELHVVADAFPVEAGKEGGRTGSVKALVVKENANSHIPPFAGFAGGPQNSQPGREDPSAKENRIDGFRGSVKRRQSGWGFV